MKAQRAYQSDILPLVQLQGFTPNLDRREQRFALQAATGLNAVEVAVDVDLEQDRRVVRRATRHGRIGTLEAQVSQLELFDKCIDDPNGVVLANVVVKAFG